MGAELFHADGRTDRWPDRQTDRHDEVNSRFSSFAKAPKRDFFQLRYVCLSFRHSDSMHQNDSQLAEFRNTSYSEFLLKDVDILQF
jgi:hypothetical protein